MLREYDQLIKDWLENLDSISELGVYVVFSTPERVFSQMKDLLGLNIEQVPVPIISYHRASEPELEISRWVYPFSGYRRFKYSEISVVIGTGDGVTTHFEGTLSSCPIKPGSITITAGTVKLNDNSEGSLIGSAGSGTINYNTGVYSIDFNTPPSSGLSIQADYQTLLRVNIANKPRLYRIRYQIDIWTRRINDMNQILEDILDDFDMQHYNYLLIDFGETWGKKYVPCLLSGITDNSDLEPMEEERRIRKTVTVELEAYRIPELEEKKTVKDTYTKVLDMDTEEEYFEIKEEGKV